MPQRFCSPQITTVSKDGVCNITIDINVNLITEAVQSTVQGLRKSEEPVQEDDDKIDLMIPDFESGVKLEHFIEQ